MTFKELCKDWNTKVPLNINSYHYYISLGYSCVVFYKKYPTGVLFTKEIYDDVDFLTIRDLKYLLSIKDFNIDNELKYWDEISKNHNHKLSNGFNNRY